MDHKKMMPGKGGPNLNLTAPNVPGKKSAGSTPTMLASALRKKAKKVQDGCGADEISDHDGM